MTFRDLDLTCTFRVRDGLFDACGLYTCYLYL